MNLFLDTQWSDTADPELVSLSLVHGYYSEQTRDRRLFLYVVRDPLPASLSETARAQIASQPGGDRYAMSGAQITSAVRRFLARYDQPQVIFDDPIDYRLLCGVLTGSLEPEQTVPALRTLPEMRPVLINVGPVWDAYQTECKQCDPHELLPNAFIYARLLKKAYEECVGR